MTEQDGVKPQLILVTEQVEASQKDYASFLLEIITTLQTQKLRGERPDASGALAQLDAAEDNSALREWLTQSGVMSRAAFDRTLAKIVRNREIEDELGFVPSDVLDLVRRYAERQKVALTARGTITRSRPYRMGDEVINHRNADTCAGSRLIYDVANAEGDNLDSFGRELRLLSEKLKLGYPAPVIGDALATWQEETTRKLKVDAMLAIQFEKGRATGQQGTAMWEAMERACFNVCETKPGFAIAVLKKFMWQVKRKARGMPVTNHLMPVLTGAQGKGKTEFVKAMTKPLLDFTREVDFNLITDGKTTDIWSALILFIDEMGHFTKADVDAVKNVITSTERNIRTMRQNHSTPVRNQATLIGCTNKSLGQLIRDDTGGRRFAELMWTNTPDWDASNALDWTLLWQSVDENGPDPLIAASMMDCLRAQQEANRNQSPVEVWAREHGVTVTKWTRASDLHLKYREWEADAFPLNSTSQTMFGRTMTSLITTLPDFPMEKVSRNDGVSYRYVDKPSL